MADIQQWRRKINPTRTRTPAPLPTPTLDLEESDDLGYPTPKRRLKPKLSAYFNQPSKTATFVEDLSGSQLPKWPFDQVYPEPKPEEEMDSIMCHLMAEPYNHLGVHFNASLMRIFESYLSLKSENVGLRYRCSEEAATSQAVISKLHMAEKDWEDEKTDYKDEVKRLEVLLSKASRRGVAEVTLARQESKLHGRHPGGGAHKRETIFEFLEKNTQRHDNDASWSRQRATMKQPLLQSPSTQDRDLSQQLTQKKSMTNIHSDLPFGTPPVKDMRFSLTNFSILDQKAAIRRRKRPTNGSNTTDDTFSAFSTTGDLLPDESNAHPSYVEDGDDQDLADVENIANALARRRGVAPSHVMPQLLDLFGANPGAANRTCSMPNALGISVEEQSASVKGTSSGCIVKRATVMTRASGFFHKLRPQLAVDTAATPLAVSRRFSFEPGDDVASQRVQTPGLMVSPDGKALRKSASLCSMSSRTPSRIPTPVYTPGALARPRRERDESSSSLLTVIKRSDDGNSRTSSVYSSPSVCREEFIRASPCKDRDSMSGQKSRKSNRLLDHTNDLRGNGSRDGTFDEKHSNARSGVGGPPDISYAQQENFRPTN